MVEATGLGLFLYRPLAWCFLREMKYLSILMVGVALLVGGVWRLPLVLKSSTSADLR